MDCVSNNNEIITSGKNFEAKQVEISKGCANRYQTLLMGITQDKNMLEIAILEEKRKTATEDETKDIEREIESLSGGLGAGIKSLEMAHDTLIIGTFEGSLFDSGYFRLNGESIDIKDKLNDLPPVLYNTLLENAKKLMEVKEATEKN